MFLFLWLNTPAIQHKEIRIYIPKKKKIPSLTQSYSTKVPGNIFAEAKKINANGSITVQKKLLQTFVLMTEKERANAIEKRDCLAYHYHFLSSFFIWSLPQTEASKNPQKRPLRATNIEPEKETTKKSSKKGHFGNVENKLLTAHIRKLIGTCPLQNFYLIYLLRW